MAAEDGQAEIKREADRSLAKKAWDLVWNRKTPFLATLGVAIVFSVRAWACDYTETYPKGLDFEWYGNHCGPGHGTGGDAVDELDAACKRHDEAYRDARDEGTTGVSRKRDRAR